jgi:DNA-binding NtrC family response regulator
VLILVVEDDAALGLNLEDQLTDLGHSVTLAPSAELGLAAARTADFDLVLLDLHLPGRGGLELLPDLRALDPPPQVVVITARPSAENAMDALAGGALDHLTKPVDATLLADLIGRLDAAQPPPAAPADQQLGPHLVGCSRPMVAMGRQVGRVAGSQAPVLILGPSGAGKELVARAIHDRSSRSAGPFVPLNCAALPEALLEAELFGHAPGAYTGAPGRRVGWVQRAEGGTLLLDEVAELSPGAQAKLLRFLESRTYQALGESVTHQANVRVLAATNARLEALIEDGRFRADLYFRLAALQVKVPALQERLVDLPLLVARFLADAGRHEVRLTPEAAAALQQRPWPGNVRELRHAVQAALLALGPDRELRPEHLPRPVVDAARAGLGSPHERLEQAVRDLVARAPASGGADPLWHEVRARVEGALIAAALGRTHDNQVAAARLLGMNRASLRRKMAGRDSLPGAVASTLDPDASPEPSSG